DQPPLRRIFQRTKPRYTIDNPASIATSKPHDRNLCSHKASAGVIGGGTRSHSATVDADDANPHRAGVIHDSWSSTMRPVTGIIPPEKTTCDITATTSSGIICSFDLASADSARPTIAATTQVAAMSMYSSRVRFIAAPVVTAPGPHFFPRTAMTTTIADCSDANNANIRTLANR